MKKTIVMISVALGLIGTVVPAATALDEVVFQQNYNVLKGNEALANGELKEASKYLKRGIKADIGTKARASALNNLCIAEMLQDNLDTAKNACDQALRLDRREWKAHVNRGNIYRLLGENTLAKADYIRAQEIKPGEEISKNQLAKYAAAEQNVILASTK